MHADARPPDAQTASGADRPGAPTHPRYTRPTARARARARRGRGRGDCAGAGTRVAPRRRRAHPESPRGGVCRAELSHVERKGEPNTRGGRAEDGGPAGTGKERDEQSAGSSARSPERGGSAAARGRPAARRSGEHDVRVLFARVHCGRAEAVVGGFGDRPQAEEGVEEEREGGEKGKRPRGVGASLCSSFFFCSLLSPIALHTCLLCFCVASTAKHIESFQTLLCVFASSLLPPSPSSPLVFACSSPPFSFLFPFFGAGD